MLDYNEVLEQSWKKTHQLLAREFRHGFEAGYFGRYMDIKPRMSDAYSQGYAHGSDLARQEYAASAAPEQGYEDVTYEEMAKGA